MLTPVKRRVSAQRLVRCESRRRPFGRASKQRPVASTPRRDSSADAAADDEIDDAAAVADAAAVDEDDVVDD